MTTAIGSSVTNTRTDSRTNVTVKTLFTKSIDESGWLLVKLEPSSERVGVCEFTKVAITKEDSRVHFLILDGRFKGKAASLSAQNKAKCLVRASRGAGAQLVAERIGRRKGTLGVRPEANNNLLATLSFDGQTAAVTLDSDIDYEETNPASPYFKQRRHSEPLPPGTYKILTPEAAKDSGMTDYYADRRVSGSYPDLKYHTVWFPIEYAATHNSNFVHVGNISEGCVTTYELPKWNALYSHLIANRSDKDGKYVGTLTIK